MRGSVERWAGPAAIAVAAAGMLAWSWGRWPDAVVDFGRELYIAWRLSEGQVLYADVAHLHGPLSHYWNALWFRVLGVGLWTLVAVDLAILAAIVVLQYRLLSEIGDRLSATTAGLFFFFVFAFGQLVGIGNYNFVCPYSHEVTHGVALSLAAILCLHRYVRGCGEGWLLANGLAIGLVFLTKADIFLAVASATAAALLALAADDTRLRSPALLGLWLACAAAPAAVALALLACAMPPREALTSLLGSWPWIWSGQVSALAFYREGMGISDPAANLAAMLRGLAGWSGFVAVLAGLSFLPPGLLRVVAALALAALVRLTLGPLDVDVAEIARPLPVVIFLLAVLTLVGLIRERADPERRHRLAMRLALATFALGLLGKMLLNARLYHYGFALAMPATMLTVVALVAWVPGALARLGADARLFRAGTLTLCLLAALAHLDVAHQWLRSKTHGVGSGADAFFADARGPFVQAAVDDIALRLGPGETLAALPEGEMLNYLARRVNPSPYTIFTPTEMVTFGEQRVLASYREHPPDYVALVHKDTTEFGYPFFGRDYGQRLYTWIREGYQPVARFGAPPFSGEAFGIELLRRRTDPPPAPGGVANPRSSMTVGTTSR